MPGAGPRALCVYCGSSPGRGERYRDAARALGTELARRDIRLVYGGGRVGLMGDLADAALAAGGTVTGVIPRGLMERELGHDGITELLVVETMHERKARMFERSDAFAALPGGWGTLDEMFEMLTWGQLGLHRLPCAFLDVDGFYRPLVEMLDRMVDEGFVLPETRARLWSGDDIGAMLDWMGTAAPSGEGVGDVQPPARRVDPPAAPSPTAHRDPPRPPR